MSLPITYDLRGPGIEIRYKDGDLSIVGDGVPDGHFPHDGELTTAATEMGTEITAVLLSASRNLTKITLKLMLPDVVPKDTTARSEVTGAAIITRQFRDVIGQPPPDVLQQYDVKPLTGSAGSDSYPAADTPQ
ncbi:hypothetical protein [Streptomyces canus]|uniref:hypothetical protein n=1 Tax=Streptomyces canus TaxID=58343 RepID=UPI002DDBA318|nr:hypothetical protein [Streptomyces canus]WSD92718.1 hypothetical protein OG925_51620 [Streptomyces canus]